MSYIDTFDHEYIGNIGYLPIYHPLSTIEVRIFKSLVQQAI